MKRTLSIVALAAVFAFGSACKHRSTIMLSGDSTAVDSADAPVMSFETKTYDFGKIKEGEKVSVSFKFINSGKSPLIIQNAAASCGCTVPDYPHDPIAPGASSEVKVVFDSQGKSGLQNKVVSLSSNAIPRHTEINLIGEVQAK